MAEPLHMIRLELDTRRLFELARRRGLPQREIDLGYLVHCQLGELFGGLAPRPFRVERSEGAVTSVLAYGQADAEQLRCHADSFADPAVHAACRWDSLATKRMPAAWREGMKLGFEVRACPIVRMASDGPHHRKGAEVDAFLARCWRVGPEVRVDREEVYREWLGNQLEGRGARLESCQLRSFQRERIVRRTQGEQRRASVRERPDALFRGALRITDPQAFQQLLVRGVGRHRSFGFGMLLLRPC